MIIEKIIIPEKKGYKITCHRCNHYWIYAGNHQYCCTCPNCRTTIMIYNRIKKINQVEDEVKASINPITTNNRESKE